MPIKPLTPIQQLLIKEKLLSKIKMEKKITMNDTYKNDEVFLEEDEDLMKRWVDQKVVGMRASEKYKEANNYKIIEG